MVAKPTTGLPLALPGSGDQGGSRPFFHSLYSLKPPSQPITEIRGSVGEIVMNDKGVLCAVESNKVLIPPHFNRYISWGFADRSIRLGSLDSDKSTCLYELSDCGEVVCAACPNSRTLVTGSTNTVVSVWELVRGARGKGTALRLRKALYGHTEPITCLAASAAFSITASGSRDGSCIVWDLAQCAFIRQLGPHPSTVSAVAISNANGNIATSSGTRLYLWTINGEPVASIDTAASSIRGQDSSLSSVIILTIAFSTLNSWDTAHVIVSGTSDGLVKMWGLEYVQVGEGEPEAADPEALKAPSLSSLTPLESVSPELLQQRLLIQQRLHLNSLGSSSEAGLGSGLSRWNSADISPEPLSPNPVDSGVGGSRCGSLEVGTSLARTGSSDSFVFVNKEANTKARLKPGNRWRTQLVFRSKLSMHTWVERKDNAAPASVTGLGMSRDERWLYVGDGRGRIWAWTGGEERGGRADHWVQDPARSNCTSCHQRFTVADRKHHCRNCGNIFCAKCSRFESEIRSLRISRPVRVCQNCYLRLRAETPAH